MGDIVKEYRAKEGSKTKDFLSNIGFGHVLIIGICLFILISITSNKNIDPRYNYVVYAVLIGIILMMFFKQSKEKKLLPMAVVKKIAQEELDRMVKEGKEFAYDSKVYITDKCDLIFTDNLATGYADYTSWDVGFIEQVHGSQYKKEKVIRIHPYKGIVMGIRDMPLGYSGKEQRDKEIIPVGVVMGTQKTTDIASGGVAH